MEKEKQGSLRGQDLNMDIEELKKTAPEMRVQEQDIININKIRIKHGLIPIPSGKVDLISTKQLRGNFNPYTGEKYNSICTNCWIKHKPHDCGYEECPGYRLIVEDVKKTIHQE